MKGRGSGGGGTLDPRWDWQPFPMIGDVKGKVRFTPDKRAWHPSPLLGQIVLVTTLNEDGTSNLAPKSWVSMMAFRPSLLALGCNRSHWTSRNALRTGEFVVNVPGADLAAAVWRAAELPHPRRVEDVGLTPRPAGSVAPPLVEECKAHLECRVVRHLAFGDELVIFGEILAAVLDRAALERRDPYSYLELLVFLEGGTFGVVDAAQQVTFARRGVPGRLSSPAGMRPATRAASRPDRRR
jgi:flavin reductase (DIM6/NTAB) family NADH-FMN oxidoreductase RutF